MSSAPATLRRSTTLTRCKILAVTAMGVHTMHTSFARAPFALVLAATLAASYIGVAAPARADDPGAPPSYAVQAPPDATQGPPDATQAPPDAMQAPPDTMQGPPAVARLSVVDGQVGVKHGD